MLDKETIANGAPNQCPDCKVVLKNKVCRSAAGHYIGTECDCGPYSRESHYFKTYEEAQKMLDTMPGEVYERKQ